MTSAEQRWSALHHGIDPRTVPLLPAWLRFVWFVAAPLVRWRVPPTAVTAVGAVLAVAAPFAAGPSPWIAAALVSLAALCDAVDGAVAVLADRATRFGARADAVADRLADVAFAAVLWRCGAPGWLALAAAVLAVAVDAVRRVRRMPARITVAERPSFVVCALLGCGSAAVSDAGWPLVVCTGVWVGLGLLGLAQLSRRRRSGVLSSAAPRDGAKPPNAA